VYNVEKKIEKKRFTFQDNIGAISLAEPLFRTNMLAVVRYSSPKVVSIFDAKSEVFLHDNVVSSTAPVISLKFHTDHLIVVHDSKVVIHDMKKSAKTVRTTTPNPFGICAMASHKDYSIIAYPGDERGYVTVENLAQEHPPMKIKAHNGELTCLALSHDGSLLATASEKGTLIRIFNIATGEQTREFRRGTTTASITSIAFSRDCSKLACTSDKGTLHVWSVETSNRTSNFAFVTNLMNINYVSSEWSLSSYSGIEGKAECAFSIEDSSTVFVLTAMGKFMELKVPEQQGTAILLDSQNLLEDLK
jgi:WD40 repeat protein